MADTARQTPNARDGSQTSPAPPKVKTLAFVSALSGLLIVVTAQMTAPLVAANQNARIDRAIYEVVPGGTQRVAFGFSEDGLRPSPVNAGFGDCFYAVYDGQGALKGLALEGVGRGYQDVVKILYGYDPDRQIVTGMTVLESRETQGLGDRIGKDPDFLQNFKGLDAAVDLESNQLKNGIVAVMHGEKSQPWEVDGISGATVGSRAVVAILDAGLRNTLPKVRPHLDEIRKARQ